METNSSQLYFAASEILFTYESYRTDVWVLVRRLQIEVEVENCLEIPRKWKNSSLYVYLKIGFNYKIDKWITGSFPETGQEQIYY
jgi:hypothetical protein